jgi:hypothetical protein
MQQSPAWAPEPDSLRTRGFVRKTIAADAAVLLVEASDFLKEVRNWQATDPEGFDQHWRVQRGL